MAEPHDAPRRADEVRSCIVGGAMERAFELMLDFAGEFFGPEQADEVRLLSFSFRELATYERKGELSIDEVMPKRMKIARNLLALLRDLLAELQRGVASNA